MIGILKKIEKNDLLKHTIITMNSDFELESATGTMAGAEGDFLEYIPKEFEEKFKSEITKLSPQKPSTFFDTKILVKGKVAQDYRLFVMLMDAKYIITAVETEKVFRLQEKTENLMKWALVDPLTKLLNRRGYWLFTEYLINRAARSGNGVGIIYFDMDKLKDINTKLGHEGGDAAIKEMAEVMRSVTRRTDVVTRVGGDEFMIVFDLDLKKDFTVEDMCERLMALTRKEGSLSTISAGAHLVKAGLLRELSESENLREEWEKHVELADEYSAEAKRRGKNQYVTDATYERTSGPNALKRSASRLLQGIRS